MIPYGKQNIIKEDIEAIEEVMKSDYLTTGPKVSEFEIKIAKYIGVKYAIAVSNGTAALHLACMAARLKNGEELITSPLTFAASANCALYCQATPVFVDINDQGLIDPNKIEEKINTNTKIIIPVHYSGMPCDMEQISKIAKKHNLIIIEDACHALGTKYKDTNIGDCSYSDMSVFSFHPVKHITTGEGGLITTNSKDLYNRLKILRTHGITKDPAEMSQNDGLWYYEMVSLGFNYRITDIQCALGISQLNRIDSFISRRREIAKIYDNAFKNIPEITTLVEEEDQKSAYHLYPILVENKERRLEIFKKLRANNIWVQVHYIPVYFHPYYKEVGIKATCKSAELFYEREISIPMYPSITDKELDFTINTIIKIVTEG